MTYKKEESIFTSDKDGTEARKTEEELQKALDYLDSIFTNLPIGLAIMEGPEFVYTRITKPLADMNGLSIAEHIGKPVAKVLPHAAPMIIPNLEKVRATGKAILNREITVTLPSNKTLHLIDFHFPIKVGGKIKAVGAIVIDVTERKKAEEALEISEKKYRDLFENAGDGIWVISKDGKVIDANERICTMLQYKKNELIGKNITSLYADSVDMTDAKKMFEKILSGETCLFDRKMKTKEGNILDVEISARMILGEGKIIGVLRNITEIKKLKQEIKKFQKNKLKLTEKERKVFYALTKNQNRSDQRIADSINIKRSTVTSIKNKLKKENYYTTHNIISPTLLNCTMLVITRCRLKQDSVKKETFSSLKKPSHVFFSAATDKELIFMTLGDDYQKTTLSANQYANQLQDLEIIDSIENSYFPITQDSLLRFMQFSSIVNNALSLHFTDKPFEFNFSKRKLTNKDKKIIIAMAEMPYATDVEISNKTDISRPKINSLKSNLTAKNQMYSLCVPNLKKTGIHLIALNIFNFKSQVSEEAKSIIKATHNIALAASNLKEIISLSYYPDFEKYQLEHERINHDLEKDLQSQSNEILLPVNEILHLEIDFDSLIKDTLG